MSISNPRLKSRYMVHFFEQAEMLQCYGFFLAEAYSSQELCHACMQPIHGVYAVGFGSQFDLDNGREATCRVCGPCIEEALELYNEGCVPCMAAFFKHGAAFGYTPLNGSMLKLHDTLFESHGTGNFFLQDYFL